MEVWSAVRTAVWWTCVWLCTGLAPLVRAGRCEQITVPFCRGLRYNFTSMPNALGHDRQHDVRFELLYLSEMVEARCSPHARRFLCAMFLPRCSWTGPHDMRVEHPCRQDCELVRNGCEKFLSRSGSTWPSFLSCDRLPEDRCLQISAPVAPSIEIIVSSDTADNSVSSLILFKFYNSPVLLTLFTTVSFALFCDLFLVDF